MDSGSMTMLDSSPSEFSDSSSDDAVLDVTPGATTPFGMQRPDAGRSVIAIGLRRSAAVLCPEPDADDHHAGLGMLNRLPRHLIADVSARLRWREVICLSRCSSQLHRQHDLWVHHRMQHAADQSMIVDALKGITTLPHARRASLLNDFSVRMSAVKGAGAPTVLEMWRQCFANVKLWLQSQTEGTYRDGTVDLLLAGYRVVSPKDRVKPEWVVCDTLRFMSTLPLMSWPPVLTVLLDNGGHAEELAFYVEKFVRRFGGALPRTSDPLATAMAQALVLRIKTGNVSNTLKHRFSVSDEQQDRIANEVAQGIADAAARSAMAMSGEVSLDVACQRWRRGAGGIVRPLVELHYVAAMGAEMRLDNAWQILLLRSDAMSSHIRVVAQERIVAIEADTMSALADDPVSIERFFSQRESIGGIMGSRQWHSARHAVDEMPWQAQPALMHRLASRIAPLWARAWFGDEEGLRMVSDVAVWATTMVPHCLDRQQEGLAARALAASLSLCVTFYDVDPATSKDVAREIFDCGLAMLPPSQWGVLLDTLCFASHRGKHGVVRALNIDRIHAATRSFLCDPLSRFVSPTPRFAKWLCREAPACWERLPDGPASHQRWQAFCDRFDFLPAMRQALRHGVLAYYAKRLESQPEPLAEVLSRAGFADAQGQQDIEDALWRIQSHWPSYTPLQTRQAVFGLTTRLQEKIENEGRGITAIQIMATVTR